MYSVLTAQKVSFESRERDDLLLQIAALKLQLDRALEKAFYDLLNEDVLAISRELDVLINESLIVRPGKA